MNLKMISLVTTAIIISLSGCDSNNTKEHSSNTKNKGKSSSISKLDENHIPEIVGLWKIYKVETKDGKADMLSKNYYLNIKEDKSYESNENKGTWFLCYSNLKENLQPLIIFKPFHDTTSNYYYDDAKILKSTITVENKTTFLKLSDLDNYRISTWVHQN